MESLTGVLMCGLSASSLFAIVTRLVDREVRLSPELVKSVALWESGKARPIDSPAAEPMPSR